MNVSSSGSLAIVSSGSAGRVYGYEKAVEVCNPRTLSCAPLPGVVRLERNNSSGLSKSVLLTSSRTRTPRLRRLTRSQLVAQWLIAPYVKSPATSQGAVPPGWFSAHTLNIWNAKTRSSLQVAKVIGVSVPTWSRDGKHLLYVSDDSLWLVPARGGKPERIEGPLFPRPEWLRQTYDPLQPIEYYGQVNWTGQFSWWTPS